MSCVFLLGWFFSGPSSLCPHKNGRGGALNCAVRFVEDNDDDDAAMSKGIQIVELLRDAGGNAREATLDRSFMGDPPTFSYFDY